MIYDNKSQEEIDAALQSFLAQVKLRTGREPNLSELKEKILKKAEQKEAEMFEAVFGSYTPQSLLTAARLLTEKTEQDDTKVQQNSTNLEFKSNKHKKK